MIRTLIPSLAAAAAPLALMIGLVPRAAAQDASAKLYAKAEGENVLVAIQITPDFGCWIYDQGEDVGGTPTTVSLGGLNGAAWTDVWFPYPKIKEDPVFGDARIFDKKTILYAVASGIGADAPVESVTATVNGQVCDEGQCVPWSVELTRRGAGTDAVWDGFPAALLTAEPTAVAAPAGSATAPQAGADTAAGDAPRWTPMFGDERAMARAFAREVDGEVEVVIQVATPEHWHMYHGPTAEDMGPGIGTPTTIEVEGGNVDWGDAKHPRPFRYNQDDENWLWAYEGTFYFGVRGEPYDDFDPEDVAITVAGQSCDAGQCVPVNLTPKIEGEGEPAMYAAAFAAWTLPEGGGRSASAGAEPAGVPVLNGKREFGQKTQSDGLLGFILLAIGAGLFTLLMPCTYPMIPITISYFTKQADTRGGKVLPLALAYGAGIVLIFVALGVLFGPIMGQIAALPSTNIVIGVLFVLFAFALFGMIDLRPPAFMMNFAGSASSKGGYLGVFLMGLTLVITSFTCTGPFVGSLLAAGSGAGWQQTAIGMGAFGLTMATPFVLLALVPGRLSAMPSAGAWMNTIKVFMGFVELAASLKFFSNADITLEAMMLPREVFLILWTGIAFVAGYYLLGRINLKSESPDGDIGPGRLLAATATILGGFYCLIGAMGYQLDSFIMSAMAPPPSYTRGLVESHRPYRVPAGDLPEGVEVEAGSYVVVDDYDLALEFARDQGLGLIVNFTGHT